jgi:drug/metabolite transporter (DMT)-like permease
MLKLFLVLFVALAFESAGVVFMKKGMNQVGEIRGLNAAEFFRVVKIGATSPQLLLGICFESIFFLCLMALMTKSDISFLWPLTALTFVFSTISAMIFLGEHVSFVRWIGVLLIILGAGFITYSDFGKQSAPPAQQTDSATR